MQELLQQLDQHVAALRPGYYAQLQVPLDEAAINNLEQQYGQKTARRPATAFTAGETGSGMIVMTAL